ncbi:SMP-30/gluconolactonase/LRE family protein [Acuticoccus mangrovi]|uniref:SMP-30/gluconolactonase/LRE family protein n=1 Tax=Acuticoccus mangrovi TaxID=2796142 RepID=A0A934MHP7_9HYPH|nr:SMP-30/gluconolactonase/LRE family protein [Acuticoccus mangrovi]MBJ3777898.1 SMP-30/gluconolactonase/LRE family protein [Acuticoccus mangrovi]
MTQPTIPLESLSIHGAGLHRPECVVVHDSGCIVVPDWTDEGGVAVVEIASGRVGHVLARRAGAGLKPNGIMLEAGGSVLLTHLGAEDGGVYRLFPDGRDEPVLTAADGAPLPPTNFVAKDPQGRLYVTVSTRHVPRHRAAHAGVRDGFIVLCPVDGEPRIVADGLGYTNECVFDAAGRHLYVNETFSRETSRFAVAPDGSLGPREVVARYGDGIYPDGLAFDVEGGLWVTSIVSNTVLRVLPDGSRTLMVQDRDDDYVAVMERAYGAGSLTRELLDAHHAGRLKNISNLAFGGEGHRTIFLGCLAGEAIVSLPAPVAGLPLPQQSVDIAPLVAAAFA